MRTIKKAAPIAALIVAGTLLFTGCGKAEEPIKEPKPVATQTVEETPAPSEDAGLSPVEQKVVEVYRLALPDTTLSDEEIVTSAENTAESLVTYLDMDGTGSGYLTERIAQGEDPVVVAAEVTGAIALHPEIADHPNYKK